MKTTKEKCPRCSQNGLVYREPKTILFKTINGEKKINIPEGVFCLNCRFSFEIEKSCNISI